MYWFWYILTINWFHKCVCISTFFFGQEKRGFYFMEREKKFPDRCLLMLVFYSIISFWYFIKLKHTHTHSIATATATANQKYTMFGLIHAMDASSSIKNGLSEVVIHFWHYGNQGLKIHILLAVAHSRSTLWKLSVPFCYILWRFQPRTPHLRTIQNGWNSTLFVRQCVNANNELMFICVCVCVFQIRLVK